MPGEGLGSDCLHDVRFGVLLVRSGEPRSWTSAGGTRGSSTRDILAALEATGLGWGNVGHVILTHYHLDHAGSTAEVLAAAPDAQGYAGAEDIPHSSSPGRLSRW